MSEPISQFLFKLGERCWASVAWKKGCSLTLLKPDAKITLTRDQMHKLFVAVKQAIAEIILTYTGHLPGAPDPSKIVGIAIQNAGPRKT